MLKKMIYSIIVLVVISGCLPNVSQLPSEQFESEPVSLETFPLKELEFYDKLNNNRVYTADDSEIIQWNSILANNCQTHYPNHPGYDKTILAKGIYENGELNYELRINSKARNVDLVPVRVEKSGRWTNTFVLGIYRCEGLEELIRQFSLMP
jgi:hypothetical protein